MKIFIWEGDGISSGYHDNGTLVVLAETVEQAREVAIAMWTAEKAAAKRNNEAWARFYTKERKSMPRFHAPDPLAFDGPREVIERRPDRIVALDTPRVVAFNGGGYD